MTKAKRKGSALDVPMALLAASSVAFAVFAMPDWRFEAAVQATGLPLVLSAANPPLGLTARLAAVAAAALGTFLAVWLTLKALGRKSPPPRRVGEITELQAEAPKVRRADAHPDAPSRLPIRAALDLGEPAAPDHSEPEPELEPEPSEESMSFDSFEESPRAGFTLVQQPEEADRTRSKGVAAVKRKSRPSHSSFRSGMSRRLRSRPSRRSKCWKWSRKASRT